MSHISTTLTKLAHSISDMENKVGVETAAGSQAAAKVTATKKAVAQAQALLAKTQGVNKTRDAKQAQIEAAKAAWVKANQAVEAAPKLNPKALKEALSVAFPVSNGIGAGDLDRAVHAVHTHDDSLKGLTTKQQDALRDSKKQLTHHQAELDKATLHLDDAIQKLLAESVTLSDSQKAADDSFASGMKLAQAGDLPSLYRGVVKYADFVSSQKKISNAEEQYKKALHHANEALSAWQTAVASEADAEADVISKQLDCDAALAVLTAAQQTRDQNAQKAVHHALTAAPKAKTPSPSA